MLMLLRHRPKMEEREKLYVHYYRKFNSAMRSEAKAKEEAGNLKVKTSPIK